MVSHDAETQIVSCQKRSQDAFNEPASLLIPTQRLLSSSSRCSDLNGSGSDIDDEEFAEFDDISAGFAGSPATSHYPSSSSAMPQVILIPNHRIVSATSGSRRSFVVFEIRSEFADGMVFSTWHRYSTIRKVLLPLIPRTSRLCRLFPPRQTLNRSTKKLVHSRRFHLQFFLQKLMHRLFFFEEALEGTTTRNKRQQRMLAKQLVFMKFVRGDGMEGPVARSTSSFPTSDFSSPSAQDFSQYHRESIAREPLAVLSVPTAGIGNPLSLWHKPSLSQTRGKHAPSCVAAALSPFEEDEISQCHSLVHQHHNRIQRCDEVSPTNECNKTFQANDCNINPVLKSAIGRPPTPRRRDREFATSTNSRDSLGEKENGPSVRFRGRALFQHTSS
jgi:hypothetical protein